MTRTGQLAGGTSRVIGWSDNNTTVTASCPATAVQTGIYSGMANAPQITVSATLPYPSLFGALTGFNSTINVSAKDQAAVMGI